MKNFKTTKLSIFALLFAAITGLMASFPGLVRAAEPQSQADCPAGTTFVSGQIRSGIAQDTGNLNNINNPATAKPNECVTPVSLPSITITCPDGGTVSGVNPNISPADQAVLCNGGAGPAKHGGASVNSACNQSQSFLSFPTWYKYLNVQPDSSGRCNVVLPKEPGTDPVKGPTDIKVAASRILLAVFEIMLRLAGILAVIFVMWGGIKYQLSQGSADEVEKARSTILNALIGVAIVLSATVIVNLIGNNLG